MVSVQFCALCRRRFTLVEFCFLALDAPSRADWSFTAAAAMPHAHKPNFDARIQKIDVCHPTRRQNSPCLGALCCSMHPLCPAFSQLFLFPSPFSHLLLFPAFLNAMSGVAFGTILLRFEGIATRRSSTVKVLEQDMVVG